MGRPKTRKVRGGETLNIGMRVPGQMVEAIDRVAEELSKEHFGQTFTRTDAMRQLLEEALLARARAR